MKKPYRRMLLSHRLFKRKSYERERPPPTASPHAGDLAWDSNPQPVVQTRTWNRYKPAFHPIEAPDEDKHIVLWDEIDDTYSEII